MGTMNTAIQLGAMTCFIMGLVVFYLALTQPVRRKR